MRVLELEPGRSPREQGRAHGETFRPLVAELAAIRTDLAIARGSCTRSDQVRALADAHLPVLERFDPALHAELIGIAEGADVPPADVVVLNHYTDLRDVPWPPAGESAGGAPPAPRDEECSAVWARTPGGPLLGQTWDMHGTAMAYVMMLRVPGRDGVPGCWAFTLTGCLGMTGLNEAGVGITINNLTSTDARVGVVWPALVRRALRERSAEAARDVVTGAPLGSGHHYLVADAAHAFGIETSGAERRQVFSGDGVAYVHTNHCLDPAVAGHTVVSELSTTHARYEALTRGLAAAPLRDRADLWGRLGSHEGYPRSVCTHMARPTEPDLMLTCGGVVMDLASRDLWASHGCLHQARPHLFSHGDAANG